MNKGFRLIYLILAVVIIGMGGKFYIGDLEKDKEVEAVVPDPDLGEDSTAEEDLEEVVYKYTTANLNLRKGPSTQEDIMLTIPRGQRVEVLESEKGWDKLKYNETIGYSSNGYLSKDQLKEEMGQVEATEGLTIINGILLVNKEYGLPMGYDPGPDPVAK
ncbi:MAG: SH3 domain-containing protein, partial [Tissierellia bacterium]|nr:SH3 domain-containing protein [Tissierellia bacterium]